MASFNINFKTQELANLYLNVGGAAQSDLMAFRKAGDAATKEELAQLDNRISAFQSAITDSAKPVSDGGKTGSEDFPYDKEFLKREFMNEVLASLLKRNYGAPLQNVYDPAKAIWGYVPGADPAKDVTFGLGSTVAPTSVSPVIATPGDTKGLLQGKLYRAVEVRPIPPATVVTQWRQGELIWDGGNFDSMTPAQIKSGLSDAGDRIYDAYSAWIDAVFVQGNKMKSNPTDPATGQSVVSQVVTGIPARVINGIVYDRVTSRPVLDAQGAPVLDAMGQPTFKVYLVPANVQTYQGVKTSVKGIVANGETGISAVGPEVDSRIGLEPAVLNGQPRVDPYNETDPLPIAPYLEVDRNLEPYPTVPDGAVPTFIRARNLSPSWYLYYWNEARVKVLRGQLNYLDAVASEIKDDLIKANKAYGDLEAKAGATRSQSADGKETDPNATFETTTLDFFEATNATISTTGAELFDTGGTSVLKDPTKAERIISDVAGGDSHSFSQWQTNRSKLKAYIDRKSTDAQRATQDYQGLLNKFNSAYEIMSKLQEKMDGLVKGQLRNF